MAVILGRFVRFLCKVKWSRLPYLIRRDANTFVDFIIKITFCLVSHRKIWLMPYGNLCTSMHCKFICTSYTEPQIRKQSPLFCLGTYYDMQCFHINNNSFLHLNQTLDVCIHRNPHIENYFAEKPLFILCTLLHY